MRQFRSRITLVGIKPFPLSRTRIDLLFFMDSDQSPREVRNGKVPALQIGALVLRIPINDGIAGVVGFDNYLVFLCSNAAT